MTIEFESKELTKIRIHAQEIDPDQFDDKGLPTDIHVVMYDLEGKTLYDAVRAHNKVDIFDTYHDKLKPKGRVMGIRSGYGTVRPNLYGNKQDHD